MFLCLPHHLNIFRKNIFWNSTTYFGKGRFGLTTSKYMGTQKWKISISDIWPPKKWLLWNRSLSRGGTRFFFDHRNQHIVLPYWAWNSLKHSNCTLYRQESVSERESSLSFTTYSNLIFVPEIRKICHL